MARTKYRVGDVLMTKGGSVFEVKAVVYCRDINSKCSGTHYVLKNHPHKEVCIEYAEKHFIGGSKAAKVLYGSV